MDTVPYRLGLYGKHLTVEIAGDELWRLDKINMLTSPPQIRFIKTASIDKDEVRTQSNWNPFPDSLGIVRHKAVLARIVDRMTVPEVVKLINFFASQQEAGPINNGILSDDHGRAYLTAPDLGWGWRLERQERDWMVVRYQSKRVNPVTESTLHFSRFASICIPVNEFVGSIRNDFGAFVDPYSVKELIKGKKGRKYNAGHYIDIPWTKQEVVTNATG
jgi:hypothetical protein